jgi:hypothetical protein
MIQLKLKKCNKLGIGILSGKELFAIATLFLFITGTVCLKAQVEPSHIWAHMTDSTFQNQNELRSLGGGFIVS